jgi:hypothetical protein
MNISIHWLRGDRGILYRFVLYGFAAGTLTYVSSLTYEQDLDNIAMLMNFPAIIILFGIEWSIANQNGFSILSGNPYQFLPIILGSAAIWSFIGLVVYAFVKMFKLGP